MHNQLKSIDFSRNPNLQVVSISYNQLTKLDVTQNKQLLTLTSSINQISEVRFSQHPELVILHVDSNRIQSLDVSSFSSLQTFHCERNALDSVELVRIAHDIRDFTLEDGDNWGGVYYSPENPYINQLFEAKRWWPNSTPYSLYRTQDNTFELVKAVLAQKMNPVTFKRFMEIYEGKGL